MDEKARRYHAEWVRKSVLLWGFQLARIVALVSSVACYWDKQLRYIV